MTWLGRQTDLSFRLHGGLLRGREVHYSSLIRARRANQTGGEDAASVAKRSRDEERCRWNRRVKRREPNEIRSVAADRRFYRAGVDDLNICLTIVRTFASARLHLNSELFRRIDYAPVSLRIIELSIYTFILNVTALKSILIRKYRHTSNIEPLYFSLVRLVR